MAKRTEGRTGAPLIFTFHGTGGNEDQFHSFAEQILPGAHVVSPRGNVSERGALRFFKRAGEGIYDMDDLAARAQAMGDFIAGEVERTGATRVIGLGYSNGANILASVAFERPELVHDLVLMHPLIPWQPEAQPGLAGRRALITAGERDPISPAPITRQLAGYFTAQGVELALHWHPGGHEIAQTEVDAVLSFLQPYRMTKAA